MWHGFIRQNFGRIFFRCKFRIFFSLVYRILKIKATLRMCKLRFMYVSWYVFASFLYLQVLTLSCLWKCWNSVRTTRPRQFDRSQEYCMPYPKRHANKLFFIRMVSLAPLSISLIFESLIFFGFNTTWTQFSILDSRKPCWFILALRHANLLIMELDTTSKTRIKWLPHLCCLT